MRARKYNRGTPEERFLARIVKSADCWEYDGYRYRGYGKFGVSSSLSVLAHKFAYELWVGQVPKGQHLHHLCGNRACVRPDHLVLVTPGEHSSAHIRERGWVRNQYGETWPVARTSEERRIRNRDWMRAKRAGGKDAQGNTYGVGVDGARPRGGR